VSDVGDHRLQLVAADSEVACTSEVEVLFGFATGGNENGAGDQRAFLQLESRVLPDVAEQVGDGVAGEAFVDRRCRRATCKETPCEFTSRDDAWVGLVVAHHAPNY